MREAALAAACLLAAAYFSVLLHAGGLWTAATLGGLAGAAIAYGLTKTDRLGGRLTTANGER